MYRGRWNGKDGDVDTFRPDLIGRPDVSGKGTMFAKSRSAERRIFLRGGIVGPRQSSIAKESSSEGDGRLGIFLWICVTIL